MNGISAFYNAVFNNGVVTNVYVIKNNGILDFNMIANVYLLKYNGILHAAVNNTTACNQTVLYGTAYVVFCRG